MSNSQEFIFAYENDYFNRVKSLLTSNIDISNWNRYACRYALQTRQMDINEYAFVYACANSNLNMVKWLLEINPSINISIDHNIVFVSACQNCHLDIAK